jgi:hypothetical protein
VSIASNRKPNSAANGLLNERIRRERNCAADENGVRQDDLQTASAGCYGNKLLLQNNNLEE